MYAFTPDESSLVFLDPFGLTRLTFPKKIKTDRKVLGSDTCGHVSISADGTKALSWRDGWDSVVVWDLPALKAAHRYDRFRVSGAQRHPDGRHVVRRASNTLEIIPIGEPDGETLPLTRTTPTPTPTLPPITGGRGNLDPAPSLVVSPDGAFAAIYGAVVYGGTLAAGVQWTRPVDDDAGGRVLMFPHAERPIVILDAGSRARVYDGDGHLDISSVSPPAACGRWLAYQPESAVVVRRNLDTGEEQRFDVERRAAKRPFDHANAGLGSLLLGPTRLLFVPWHRESIVDLVAGVELARKLPDRNRAVREEALALTTPLTAAARAAGMSLDVIEYELNDKRSSLSVTSRVAGGGNLLTALLGTAIRSIWNEAKPGGYRMSSYGTHGSVVYLRVVTQAELLDAIVGMQGSQLPPSALIELFASLYARRAPGRSRYADEADKACEPAADALFARYLLAVLQGEPIDGPALAAAGAPTVEECLAGVADYETRAEPHCFQISQALAAALNRLLGVDAAAVWISIFFEQPWSYFGTKYYDFEQHGVVALAKQHPEARGRLLAWVKEHGLPKNQDHRFYVERVTQTLLALD